MQRSMMDHHEDTNTMGSWTDLIKKVKRAESDLKFAGTWNSMAKAKERRSNFKIIQGGKSNGKKGKR